ncbi:MAG: PPC domain-containing DNA-binding protein [Flavobacteriales bacterium]
MIAAIGRPYQVHVLRLLPGEDVRELLDRWCNDRSIEAAAVSSAVGSLTRATIRFGGRSEGIVLEGDLEVCSLSGTLSRRGLHLHLAVADGDGHITGGHLLAGCLVRTTLELVVQEIGGLRLLRKPDPATGYDELLPEVIAP